MAYYVNDTAITLHGNKQNKTSDLLENHLNLCVIVNIGRLND